MNQPDYRLWFILPAKGFFRAKSRLDPVLSPQVRSAFARGLFEHVLGTILQLEEASGVLVLTEDDEVESLARGRGAQVLRDRSANGLASIVDAGLSRVHALGASAALVCMADLPHLTVDELRQAVLALRTQPVVLAPDAAEAGTNVLGLAPATLFPSCFGREDSFAAHLARARSLGHEAAVLRLHGLCFDVDGPQDLSGLDG